MQYLLTHEEYHNLLDAALCNSPMTDIEIQQYFKKIPNFGVATITNMIEYANMDGIRLYKTRKATK